MDCYLELYAEQTLFSFRVIFFSGRGGLVMVFYHRNRNETGTFSFQNYDQDVIQCVFKVLRLDSANIIIMLAAIMLLNAASYILTGFSAS